MPKIYSQKLELSEIKRKVSVNILWNWFGFFFNSERTDNSDN